MRFTALQIEFRGLACLHCGKTRPYLQIFGAKRGRFRSSDIKWVDCRSRVLSLRCRHCGRGAIYAISQIQDFPPERPKSVKNLLI